MVYNVAMHGARLRPTGNPVKNRSSSQSTVKATKRPRARLERSTRNEGLLTGAYALGRGTE